ncbi:DUF4184 family protein [Herbiconiux sp. YIM B11900]|uniref:DUF4184 family protein n=1 Tax=Herbiconiux sp. YIM B11900 TaxID=3404131 RepID=UPI003F868D12
MPFTVSHAIVALPFARSALPAAAVAAGAMAPDLPLFLPIGPLYATTHDLTWGIVASVPLAFLALAAWRMAVRPVARSVVPRALANRLPADWSGSAATGWRSLWRGRMSTASLRSGALLVVALIIGVASHLIWDAFTHSGRWGTLLVPALDRQYLGYAGTTWLQALSSALGVAGLLAAALLWFLRRRRSAPVDVAAARITPDRRAPTAFWGIVLLGLLAGTAAAFGQLGAPSVPQVGDIMFAWVTAVGGWLAIATAAAGVVVQLLPPRTPRSQDTDAA